MNKLLLVFVFGLSANAWADYFSTPRKGTNFFNQTETAERFEAAHEYGFNLIRLTPSKWTGEGRDFLIGDADNYVSIPRSDLRKLIAALDAAKERGQKVILTMLSLPGCRWAQHNKNRYDGRLWRDQKYHHQVAKFWRDLAQELKGHPAVAGYDLINEPAPERVVPLGDWYTDDYQAWYDQLKGTAADLNLFYRRVIREIRKVDPQTPIIIESGFYATPWAFQVLDRMDDPRVLYSFHMYEPYSYTRYQQREFVYPGRIPIGENGSKLVEWDKEQLGEFLKVIHEWQQSRGVSSDRIYVGEFGVYRRHPGAAQYLSDLLRVINHFGWHWTYYSFREDTWIGMDYELGGAAMTAQWWEAHERGENPPRPYTKNNLFNAIREGFARKK